MASILTCNDDAALRTERLAAIRNGDVGFVHSWELVTAVDGPGTRLTLFLSGCKLRCQYCHNPDTWRMRDGEEQTVDAVMARISRYVDVLKTMRGGVTISGGEPFLQAEFVANIVRRCKELGLHTVIDTSGYVGHRASDELLDDVDLVLLDVKSGLPETYLEVTGVELEPTYAFGRRLSQLGKPMWVRFVLVPGLTDAYDNVEAIVDYVSTLETVGRVEVLPFHQMGREKWHQLGIEYPLEATRPPKTCETERVRDQFRRLAVPVW